MSRPSSMRSQFYIVVGDYIYCGYKPMLSSVDFFNIVELFVVFKESYNAGLSRKIEPIKLRVVSNIRRNIA